MGIIQLISTISAVARAVPEIADLCETLIRVAKEYESESNKLNARQRWTDKNAAIDAAISNVQRLPDPKAEQHGQVDSSPPVQSCRYCGSRLD